MRVAITILLIGLFFSCKEEPELCNLSIQSKEKANEILLGMWKGSGRIYTFFDRGVIEEYIPNHSIVFYSEFEILSKNEILVTRDFPWMDSIRWVNELGLPPDGWSPWYADYKAPTSHQIKFFTCDSMLIEQFKPKNKESTPSTLVWNDVWFKKIEGW